MLIKWEGVVQFALCLSGDGLALRAEAIAEKWIRRSR